MLTILASGARTSSGTQTISNATHLEDAVGAMFLLDVGAIAASATSGVALTGENLVVFVQSAMDSSSSGFWDDFVRFTVASSSGAAKQIASWVRQAGVPESESRFVSDAAMAAGVLQGPVGNNWRVKWTTASTSAVYTFALSMDLVRAVRA